MKYLKKRDLEQNKKFKLLLCTFVLIVNVFKEEKVSNGIMVLYS